MEKNRNINPLQSILQNRREAQEHGLFACCSANEYVIRALFRRALKFNTVALIEATANQVNQFGGYTGMQPADFIKFVKRLAAEEGFPSNKLICGGDHLGPLTWQNLPEIEAMNHAQELIRAYVMAGFSKIHIDTSMKVLDDAPDKSLSDQIIAERGVILCQVAEEAFKEYQVKNPDAPEPVYVIGSEVPIPGGAQENEEQLSLTKAEDLRKTIETFREEFTIRDLQKAWNRVIAVVVQPGVEFADETIIEYNREKSETLVQCLKMYAPLVFEGHSTDYQTRQHLREMVEDGIAILKVGPALTFALREGLFALEQIEQENLKINDFQPSNLRMVLESTMLKDSCHWIKYYHGTPERKRFARAFSFSDRSRYYLNEQGPDQAIKTLLQNLDQFGIPLALLSQYLPKQYARVKEGSLLPKSTDLLIDHVGDCIDDYIYAIL